MLTYLNGSWVPEEQATVPFHDRGFQFGESLFETVRVNNSLPFRVSRHMDRMSSGMDTIQLDSPQIFEQIPDLINEYVERNHIQNALIKITITKGLIKVGETQTEPAIYMASREIPITGSWPKRVVFLQEQDYPILRFHPAIKSGNYLGNMLAKRDAENAGAFEPVFINNEGYVTECAIRNIFFIQNDTLLTPSVELGVLPGVIRETIMELAEREGMRVEETFIRADRVKDMEEAFISSTGVGVLPVYWEGFESSYTHSQKLMEALNTLFESGASHAT